MTATLAPSAALVVEEAIPGGSVFVEAAAPHGPAPWRPSWADLCPGSLSGQDGPGGLWRDGPMPCAGTVWSAELGRDGVLVGAPESRDCGRGVGHEGRCR